MAIAFKILDRVVFYVFGPLFALAGLSYVLVKSVFRKSENFLDGNEPLNRLTFSVMDMEKAKHQSDVLEDMLLKGSIARQISVSFDFESEKNWTSKIADNFTHYHFSVHKKGGVTRAPFQKTGAILRLVKNIFYLLDICKKEKINCVESHEAVFLGFIGLIFSRSLNAPFVLHLNTSYEEKYKARKKVSVKFLRFRRVERWLESLTARLSDVITADREFYKNSRFFPKNCVKKYVTIGIRVGASHYAGLEARRDLKKDLGIESRDAILYVGRLHPVKYVRDLIEAFKKIYARNKDACLLIAGEGVLEDELRDMARKSGLEKEVLFLGSKTQDELKDIFFTADVLVQPHGGVVLMEAALAGTPSVVYDFDWHTEFVQDGKMGFVVPFSDTDALAARTLDLLSNKQLNRKMGLYSHRTAVSGYSRERSIENERAIYDKLLRVS